ncbi:MAG TPA: hypothetical protein VLK84_17605, partial [Longimicrobium sp.]|nr:hypothetical protein [Longimicrobium sp.]
MSYGFSQGAGAAAGLIAPPAPFRKPAESKKPALALAETESLTDLGNAQRFKRIFGHDLRWVPRWKRWMQWEGTHWADVEEEDVRKLAHQVSESLQDEAKTAGDSAARKALQEHARRAKSSKDISAMLKEARALLSASPDQFDADGYLYNVANGTLDFRAKDVASVFRPHRREDYVTKVVPVAWDRAAVCPRFNRFILQIFAGHQETADFVLRTMATCLVGDLVEQAYYLWFGKKGRNGKGALQRVLNSLTDPYRVTIDPKLFFADFKYDPNSPNSAVMALRGARLVIGSEMAKDDV